MVTMNHIIGKSNRNTLRTKGMEMIYGIALEPIMIWGFNNTLRIVYI